MQSKTSKSMPWMSAASSAVNSVSLRDRSLRFRIKIWFTIYFVVVWANCMPVTTSVLPSIQHSLFSVISKYPELLTVSNPINSRCRECWGQCCALCISGVYDKLITRSVLPRASARARARVCVCLIVCDIDTSKRGGLGRIWAVPPQKKGNKLEETVEG